MGLSLSLEYSGLDDTSARVCPKHFRTAVADPKLNVFLFRITAAPRPPTPPQVASELSRHRTRKARYQLAYSQIPYYLRAN